MKKASIKDDFKQLEKIVDKLEDQQTGLEESLELFEVGSVIIKNCHKQLKKAKNKFEEIKQDLEITIEKD